MPSYHHRYINGEFEQVWIELEALGEAVQREPLRSDALAVAAETMCRVRCNIEAIAGRLEKIGYHFAAGSPSMAVLEPLQNHAELEARLEHLVGPIPLSVSAWYTNVGAVNFMGQHSAWSGDTHDLRPDPLVVDSFDLVVDDAEERFTDPAWNKERGFYLYIAPDEYHKENVSGGPPYSVIVQPTADAPLL